MFLMKIKCTTTCHCERKITRIYLCALSGQGTLFKEEKKYFQSPKTPRLSPGQITLHSVIIFLQREESLCQLALSTKAAIPGITTAPDQ